MTMATTTNYGFPKPAYNDSGGTKATEFATDMDNADGAIKTALDGKLGSTAQAADTAKVNGASVPTSKALVGTNSSGQIIDGTGATAASATLWGAYAGVAGPSQARTFTLPDADTTVAGIATTQTLTNKRVTPRVQTAADATSISPDSDAYDAVKQVNTQTAGTLTVNNPTGTPTAFQPLMLRIKTTNAMTFSWGAAYRGSTDLPLPTTLAAGKTSYYRFSYNYDDTKWDILAINAGF